MRYRFTEFEKRLIVQIAQDRIEQRREITKHYTNRSGQDELRVKCIGAAGELAFCKLFNLYPPFGETFVEYDLLWEGKRTDIKSSDRSIPSLLVKCDQTVYAERYVLMRIGFDLAFAEYIGHADIEDIRREENIWDNGYGKNFTLKPEKLKR